MVYFVQPNCDLTADDACSPGETPARDARPRAQVASR
jgi:hypothetical protein